MDIDRGALVGGDVDLPEVVSKIPVELDALSRSIRSTSPKQAMSSSPSASPLRSPSLRSSRSRVAGVQRLRLFLKLSPVKSKNLRHRRRDGPKSGIA